MFTSPSYSTYLAVIFLIQSSHSIPPQNGIWTICEPSGNYTIRCCEENNLSLLTVYRATHLALVQLFLELFHRVYSHHVVVHVIRSSV